MTAWIQAMGLTGHWVWRVLACGMTAFVVVVAILALNIRLSRWPE